VYAIIVEDSVGVSRKDLRRGGGLSLSTLLPFPVRSIGPLKPARVLGERCKLPQWGPDEDEFDAP